MAVYWITFRIASDPGHGQRYDDLVGVISDASTKWWLEPTSFILFESSKTIDEVASIVKGAVDTSKDIALIGMPDYKSARLIGLSKDQDIFDLMPFTKKV